MLLLLLLFLLVAVRLIVILTRDVHAHTYTRRHDRARDVANRIRTLLRISLPLFLSFS